MKKDGGGREGETGGKVAISSRGSGCHLIGKPLWRAVSHLWLPVLCQVGWFPGRFPPDREKASSHPLLVAFCKCHMGNPSPMSPCQQILSQKWRLAGSCLQWNLPCEGSSVCCGLLLMGCLSSSSEEQSALPGDEGCCSGMLPGRKAQALQWNTA